MKKQLLLIICLMLVNTAIFAQFNSSQIWSFNNLIDPMPHNTFTLVGISMQLDYNSTKIPVSGLSTNPAPYPTFRITNSVSGNTTTCISSEKEGNDPWEDKERLTVHNDGTNDTTLIVEENNGSGFEFRKKVKIDYSNPNKIVYSSYNYSALNNGWELISKNYDYINADRRDSTVNYSFTGNDSIIGGINIFYYSNGLDSVAGRRLEIATNQMLYVQRYIVLQKENGKTKEWAIEQRNNVNTPFTRTGTISYSNTAPIGVDETKINLQMSVYPNPAKESINIKMDNGVEVSQINIINTTGQIIKSIDFMPTISIEDLSKGVYFIQAQTNKGIFTQKVLKY
jgi:hypothetical protein